MATGMVKIEEAAMAGQPPDAKSASEKLQAYQTMLIHASTYDDMQEFNKGLQLAKSSEPADLTASFDKCISVAILNGSQSIVRYLLLFTKALRAVQPSHVGSKPSLWLLETLDRRGWDINMRDADDGSGFGKSLLHYICDDEELVSWALDHGCRPDDHIPNDSSRCLPLLDTVAGKGSVATYKLLASLGAPRGLRTLHMAVDSCAELSGPRMEMVKFLVDELELDVNGFDAPDFLPDHWDTPLCYAARWHSGHEEVVRLLLERGANPLLHSAGHPDAVRTAELSGNGGVLILLRERVAADFSWVDIANMGHG